MTEWVDCSNCDGEGGYWGDRYRPHDASRDVGVIDAEWVTCEDCGGTGEVEEPDT